jgi:hypothetical protein
MKVKIGGYPKWRWYHTYLYRLFGYAPSQKKKIHIDPWDTWSMDYTLAQIVLPMLLQLAKEKHGSPMTDLEDVPFELRGDHEDDVHDRWDWIMKEMIYAFDAKVNDIDEWEFSEEKSKRIQNGFRLFGKYYTGLWD